ncbi:MAG TPA: heavy metal-binding domain-containing protein [Sphingobacteriaceae bacterium]|nr:heavy metal-binding domain-containing protein [Sphingobacteriaceae bacterium]
MEKCPNCDAPLKSGVFNSNSLIHKSNTEIINEFAENKQKDYCFKCSSNLLEGSKNRLTIQIIELNKKLTELLPLIPVITVQSPYDWNYKIINMVTAQSVTGTGAFAEFASSITDLLGTQSNRYSTKLANGENLCFSQLRLKALEVGGNAIIATDIDYTEVGGDKGMLMVCMSGTVVKLENCDVLGNDYGDRFNELNSTMQDLTRLKNLDGIE